MKFISNQAPASKRGRGKPSQFSLSPDQELSLANIYLSTNATRHSGSMTLAWQLFCQQEGITWDHTQRASKHQLPSAAVKVMRQARTLVGVHRGGRKALIKVASAPGQLRTDENGIRLKAGDIWSADDGTINFGVYAPITGNIDDYKDDPCALKYGVILGRFQLLIIVDEATGFIPAFRYIARPEQSYRAEDVCALWTDAMQDHGMPRSIKAEGGNWQATRTLALFNHLNIKVISVMGRPNQKLVEKTFNSLWSILSAQVGGQVGRYQGEELATCKIYQACKLGHKDPTKLFISMADATDAIEKAIILYNNTQIESRTYQDKWIPAERYAAQLKANPLAIPDTACEAFKAPIIVKRKVANGCLKATAIGQMDQKMEFRFSDTWLLQHIGKEVFLHFDPLDHYPLHGHVSDLKGNILGNVSCLNPTAMGGNSHKAKAIKQNVMSEHRNIKAAGQSSRTSSVRAQGIKESLSVSTSPGKYVDIPQLDARPFRRSKVYSMSQGRLLNQQESSLSPLELVQRQASATASQTDRDLSANRRRALATRRAKSTSTANF